MSRPKIKNPSVGFESLPAGPNPRKSSDRPAPPTTRSPKMSPGEDTPARSGSGEDTEVESGVDRNDPEQPAHPDDETSLK